MEKRIIDFLDNELSFANEKPYSIRIHIDDPKEDHNFSSTSEIPYNLLKKVSYVTSIWADELTFQCKE